MGEWSNLVADQVWCCREGDVHDFGEKRSNDLERRNHFDDFRDW